MLNVHASDATNYIDGCGGWKFSTDEPLRGGEASKTQNSPKLKTFSSKFSTDEPLRGGEASKTD